MSLLSAIAFDPTIRGILVVVTGVTVLMGSIFMILGTNHGFRHAFQISAAALFGWGFLMGGIWWIYGIGLKGQDPSWTPIEINLGREALADTEELHKLPSDEELQEILDPVDTIDQYPLVKLAALGVEGEDWQPETLTEVMTQATPLLFARGVDLQSAMESAVAGTGADWAADHPEIAGVVGGPLSKLEEETHAQAKGLRDQLLEPMQGWCLLAASDSRRGDTVASVEAELALEEVFGSPTTSSNYTMLDVYFLGGKEECKPLDEYSVVERAWRRVKTTLQVKNPTLISATTLRKNITQTPVVGQAPPVPKMDDRASAVTVVMERDLGNKRFIPFVFTLANGVLFAAFALSLHSRDRRMQAMQVAHKKGS